MTDAEISLAIFNQAVDMKRKGRFDDALFNGGYGV